MHEALIPIAGMIALAHDHWRGTAGRRRPLSGKVAVLEEQVLRARMVQRLLTKHGIFPRYGAVGKSGSIRLIERFWRGMKEECVRSLFLCRATTTLDGRLERYRTWFNGERPHQGQRQRTPDDVYFARPEKPTRDLTGGMLHVRFHEGDRRLPVLRLRDAA